MDSFLSILLDASYLCDVLRIIFSFISNNINSDMGSPMGGFSCDWLGGTSYKRHYNSH